MTTTLTPGHTYVAWPAYLDGDARTQWLYARVVVAIDLKGHTGYRSVLMKTVRGGPYWRRGQLFSMQPGTWDFWPCL